MASLELLNTKITAAYDTDLDKLKAFTKLKPDIKPFDDGRSLIQSTEVDAIFIMTPTKFHKEYVAEAASAGKDVFCEKPMATTSKDAEEMLRIVQKADVKAQVGLVMRYFPILNYSKRLIEENRLKIGSPMCFIIRDDQYFPIRGSYMSTWRKEADFAGGGTLIEHSIHDIDFMRWFFGDIVELKASVRFFSGREVEDEANVWLKFENGAEAMLTSIWHELGKRESNRLAEIFFNKALFHLELDGDKRWMAPQFYQFGEDAPVRIDHKEANEYIKSKLGIQTKYDLGEYAYQDYSFIKSIESDRQPQPDFEIGVYAHRIVDAAYRSAKSNSSIKLWNK